MAKQYRIINKGKGPLAITTENLFKVGDPATADAFFPSNHPVPSAVWTITHTLNKYPSVTIVDTSGTVVIGDIKYIDTYNLIITFSAPFAGTAYLN